MLPRKNRLTKNNDFQSVYRYGSLFSFGSIFLKSQKNAKDYARVGFSVGLKFSKKAVERNKLKRQLRSLVAEKIEKIKTGVDLIVGVAGREKLDREKLEKDLTGALRKGKLI